MRRKVSELAVAARDSSDTAGTNGGSWLAAVRGRGLDPAEARKRFSQHRLGEILVMLGMISSEDRDTVLERQEKLALPFGECCVRLKLIDAGDLAQALAWQFGYLHPVSGSFTFGKELVMVSQPFGPYAEALRSVSGRLMSRWVKGGRNVLAVTSAEGGEGRTHVTANLAVSFAQAGWRTLLVDADLRRPRQHLIFDVPQHPGLSRLLCGYAPRDVVRQIEHLKYLTVITSGPLPPNPLELLGRDELSEFLDQAKEYYDVVLVDTPASTAFADAELIASAAGNALIIVRKGTTRQRKVESLAKSLTGNGVEIAGTLMTAH